jgi:Mn-dependent DtxR family transcriptional regulator
VLENRDFHGETVTLKELAERRRNTLEEARVEARALQAFGLATLDEEGHTLVLTPDGWLRAAAIVRNHRLWELYLANAAQVAVDHVHEDAEKIEHVLGEEVVRELERRFDFARKDPHGKAIPTLADIRRDGKS